MFFGNDAAARSSDPQGIKTTSSIMAAILPCQGHVRDKGSPIKTQKTTKCTH